MTASFSVRLAIQHFTDTTGQNDTGGCAMAVAYESDVSQITPDDFVVFSVNKNCVWTRHTAFTVPEDMPPCQGNKCTCAW